MYPACIPGPCKSATRGIVPSRPIAQPGLTSRQGSSELLRPDSSWYALGNYCLVGLRSGLTDTDVVAARHVLRRREYIGPWRCSTRLSTQSTSRIFRAPRTRRVLAVLGPPRLRRAAEARGRMKVKQRDICKTSSSSQLWCKITRPVSQLQKNQEFKSGGIDVELPLLSLTLLHALPSHKTPTEE